jgi:Zn-dependent protease
LANESPGASDGWVPRPRREEADTDSSVPTQGLGPAPGPDVAAAGPPCDAPSIEPALLLELGKLVNPKHSWQKNIGALVISVVLFFSLGLADKPLSGITIILSALFVHEMGHVLGMKLFRYRNVSMLFIPFFGAAVSGRSVDAPGWKRAVVTLMGPLAGLVAAFGLFICWLTTAERLAGQAALTFAILNVFNLLPLYPLDGGRFLQQVLFSRSRYLDAVFRVIMAGLTVAVSVWLEAWLLAIVGVVVMLGTGLAFRTGTVVKRLLADPDFPRVIDPGEASAESLVSTRVEL